MTDGAIHEESTASSGPAPTRLIRLSEVMDRVGLRKSMIYKMIAEGTFPPQVPLGENSVAWIEEHVQAWIDARVATIPQEERDRWARPNSVIPLRRGATFKGRRLSNATAEPVPAALSEIAGLERQPDAHRIGVYFLCEGEAVVYVGQSRELPARIEKHRRDKQFDRVFYVPCKAHELDYVEAQYIAQLKPRLNWPYKPPTSVQATRTHRLNRG